MPNKSNTENFVTRAKEIHGDKYDYKNVNYINNRTPITITCPKHGDFLQTPHIKNIVEQIIDKILEL